MTKQIFLAVDIGTSSSKGVLVNDRGNLLASASRSHSPTTPEPGHVEMDGDLWWQEFLEISSELLELQGYTGDQVTAIGVSGMGPCALVTDSRGKPLRPAILYGVDTRSSKQIAAIETELGREEILKGTGSLLTSQAIGPKLRWIHDVEPEVWNSASKFFMPSSWLTFKLTGEYVLDHHSASQCNPMYDPLGHQWNAWAHELSPRLSLPQLKWPGEIAGRTVSNVCGIPAGTPVITGTIDAWSEAVGVNAQTPGDLMIMYGTTMFFVATTDSRQISPTMWGTVGAYPGTYNLAGGMSTSGAITHWFSEITGKDYPALLAEAAGSPVGANGLLMLPYFAGERTPIFDPNARGVIAGLTTSHTRGDVYRAILEATAYGVRHNIDTMREAGIEIGRIVATGGGVQGRMWTEIVSSATGLEQVIPTYSIGAAYGASLLAAQSQGINVTEWNPPARIELPDPRAYTIYDEQYSYYRQMYPATKTIMHALSAFQQRTTGSS